MKYKMLILVKKHVIMFMKKVIYYSDVKLYNGDYD